MSTLKKMANKKLQQAITKTKHRDNARQTRNAKKQQAFKKYEGGGDDDEIDSDEVQSIDEEVNENKDDFFIQEEGKCLYHSI